MDVTDDAFRRYAEEHNKKEDKGSSKTYDEIAWTCCETGIPKIVRVVGGSPGNGNPADARVVNIAWVVGDDGKKFKLIRPSINEDPNYIINKIIQKVNSPRWVNKTKTFPVADSHPEIYARINKNGVNPGDKRYNFEKGWTGKEVIIMNVIDRSQMDWHRTNKHTMLLAKGENEGKENTKFVDEGISAYAVSSRLSHLFKAYGSWEKYDIALTRTGMKDNPYIIFNASNSPMEVDEDYRDFISDEKSLSDEERSWETYDLNKLYKITPATKIYNRLKNFILQMDMELGTNFYKELEALVKEEKSKEVEDAINTPSYTSETVEETNLITNVEEPILPYMDALTEEQQKLIKSVREGENGFYDITWDIPVNEQASRLAACPVCHTVAPMEVTKCPACGQQF